jgi:hypothetical protein
MKRILSIAAIWFSRGLREPWFSDAFKHFPPGSES